MLGEERGTRWIKEDKKASVLSQRGCKQEEPRKSSFLCWGTSVSLQHPLSKEAPIASEWKWREVNVGCPLRTELELLMSPRSGLSLVISQCLWPLSCRGPSLSSSFVFTNRHDVYGEAGMSFTRAATEVWFPEAIHPWAGEDGTWQGLSTHRLFPKIIFKLFH